MRAEPFAVPVDGGLLRGHRYGSGRCALLLHGGAAVPDYLAECAQTLDGLFETIRYTQRGTPPSGGGPPYTVEAHVADAVAVLDALEIDRAWVIGHSWGGHLALHLLVSRPERLRGVLCIDPLGASSDGLQEQDANLRRGLDAATVARLDEIEDRRRRGDVTEAELIERFAIVWPQYFADGKPSIAPPQRVGVAASIDTNRSLAEHFAARTLERALPGAAGVPVLFVHGEDDVVPVRSTLATAALVPGARVETIAHCGHFPWLEQPAAFRAAVERLLAQSSVK
jgi:proline iminopeptidase